MRLLRLLKLVSLMLLRLICWLFQRPVLWGLCCLLDMWARCLGCPGGFHLNRFIFIMIIIYATIFKTKKGKNGKFSQLGLDIFPASSHRKNVQDHPSYHLLIYYIVINFYPNESCILLLKYIIITWPSLWMFIVFFTRPSGVCSLVESTCIYILCLSSLKITRPSKLCETQLFRLWVDTCEKLVWVENVW